MLASFLGDCEDALHSFEVCDGCAQSLKVCEGMLHFFRVHEFFVVSVSVFTKHVDILICFQTISFTMSFAVPRVQGETETAVISLNVTR